LNTIGTPLALHGGLQGGILEGDDHLGLGVDRGVDQARECRQIALGAGDLELVVLPFLHVRFPHPQLDRVLTPFATHPVGRANQGDQGSAAAACGVDAGRLAPARRTGIRLGAGDAKGERGGQAEQPEGRSRVPRGSKRTGHGCASRV